MDDTIENHTTQFRKDATMGAVPLHPGPNECGVKSLSYIYNIVQYASNRIYVTMNNSGHSLTFGIDRLISVRLSEDQGEWFQDGASPPLPVIFIQKIKRAVVFGTRIAIRVRWAAADRAGQ